MMPILDAGALVCVSAEVLGDWVHRSLEKGRPGVALSCHDLPNILSMIKSGGRSSPTTCSS